MQVAFELAFERFPRPLSPDAGNSAFIPAYFPVGLCRGLRGLIRLLVPWLGRDFFPKVDAGQFKNARAGKGRHTNRRDRESLRPDRELSSGADSAREVPAHRQHGCPTVASTFLTATQRRPGPADADVLVTLNKDHRPTDDIVHDLRLKLRDQFPVCRFFLPPGRHREPDFELGSPAP